MEEVFETAHNTAFGSGETVINPGTKPSMSNVSGTAVDDGRTETIRLDNTGTPQEAPGKNAYQNSTAEVTVTAQAVQTAKAAGLELAAVSWGFASAQSLKQAGAKRIFDTVGALEEYILR